MVVGALMIELKLAGCHSLKEKRHILRGLMDKLRNQFHVAVSEVDDMDLWQNATIGVSCVSNNEAQVESVLQHVTDFVDANPLVEAVGIASDFIRF
jgi:uncharacterized protein YlxP (DUF503 family)